MRIQTEFELENSDVPSDDPDYPAYLLKSMARLVAAKMAMLLRR